MSATGTSTTSEKDLRAGLITDNHERFVHEEFKGLFAKRSAAANDGEPTGTAGDVNNLIGDRNCFQWHVIGTQTILGPVRTSAGLNICLDAENNDGIELTLGCEEPANTVISNVAGATRGTFVVGTDPAFYASFKFTLADVSGLDACLFGFRKCEAYQAVLENAYDEMAAFDVRAGDIYITTILNNASNSDTDTTQNWLDTETHTLTVIVDSLGAMFGTPRGVYFEIDGVKPTAVPSTLFRFDSGEIVQPFFGYRHDTDVCDTVIAKIWESGLVGGGVGQLTQWASQRS